MSTSATPPTSSTSPSTPSGASTASATSTSSAATTQLQKIGQIVELAGIGAFAAGIVLSIHHYAIGAFCVSGAVAYIVGKKLHGS